MSHKASGGERLIAALTYATLGWAGVIVLVLQAIGKMRPSIFVMYHVLQSIFLFFAYFVLCQICDLLIVLISGIPLLNMIPILLNSSLPLLGGLSLVQAIVYTILIYLILSSLGGRFSYLPWISGIIRYWVKR